MHSILITNVHGSLIYARSFEEGPQTANDWILLASTFHGLCAISKQLEGSLNAEGSHFSKRIATASPQISKTEIRTESLPPYIGEKSDANLHKTSSRPTRSVTGETPLRLKHKNIVRIQTGEFNIHCLESWTGLKFILVVPISYRKITTETVTRFRKREHLQKLQAAQLGRVKQLAAERRIPSKDFVLNQVQVCLKSLYQAYCDFVSKNPFYEDQMPIKCSLFDNQIFFLYETFMDTILSF